MKFIPNRPLPLHRSSMGFTTLALYAIAAASSAGPHAHAQTLSVSASGYTAIEPAPIPVDEFLPLTVTMLKDTATKKEIEAYGGQMFTQPVGIGLEDTILASAVSEGYASAEQGRLRIYGGLSALAPPTQISPNVPPSPNQLTAHAHLQIATSFSDYILINEPTLPVGAAFNLSMDLNVDLITNRILNYPPHSGDPISLNVGFQVGTDLRFQFGTNPGYNGYFPWNMKVLGPDQYLYSFPYSPFTFTVPVINGDLLYVSGGMSISGYVRANDPVFTRDGYGLGAFIDGRNTATMTFGTLPSGGHLIGTSGHDFSGAFLEPAPEPGSAAAPEPGTCAFMAIGALLPAAGAALRKRRNP